MWSLLLSAFQKILIYYIFLENSLIFNFNIEFTVHVDLELFCNFITDISPLIYFTASNISGE